MKMADAAFEKLFPSNEDLWARAGAHMETRDIEPGHQETVPFFNLSIDSIKKVREQKIKQNRSQRVGGRTLAYTVVMSDEIDREVHIHLPDESDSNFVVTDGAAWTTRNDGYAKHRAQSIVGKNGIPVVQVGAEHSSARGISCRSLRRLGRTVHNSLSISLAKTAESEEIIINHFMDEFDLPRHQYAIGDSRGAMKVPSQYPYAKEYGSEIVYMDTKAPCIPDKVSADVVPRFAAWGATEIIGGVAVIGAMSLRGHAGTLRHTTSINPNFVASTVIGLMPALAAGSDMTRFMPHTAHGQIVIYDHDLLTYGKRWDERYQSYENIFVKHVPKGIHANLLDPSAHTQQLDRISRFDEIHRYNGGDVNLMTEGEKYYIRHGDEYYGYMRFRSTARIA